MTLLNDADAIRKLLRRFKSRNIAVPCFCAENTYTVEGICIGATKAAEELGLDSLPLFIAATGSYHGRQQLANYTSLNSTREGFMAFRSDLERLGRADGPFPKVTVIPSLDHGQPQSDEFLFEEGKDFWGCVMYDCSTLTLKENIKKTVEFVKKHRDDYLIEGCVDEILESGETEKMRLTDPQQAKAYLEQTGVDLMVVNLGTEHRATKSGKKYHGDLARKISDLAGHVLVLHGTSCLDENNLGSLCDDGILKVNTWAVLETTGAKELIKYFSHNVDGRAGSLELEYLTETFRRNQIKVPVISSIVERFIKHFGYERLLRSDIKR